MKQIQYRSRLDAPEFTPAVVFQKSVMPLAGRNTDVVGAVVFAVAILVMRDFTRLQLLPLFPFRHGEMLVVST